MIDQESIEYRQDETDRENPKNEASEERKTEKRSEKSKEQRRKAPERISGLDRLRRQREIIEARIQSAQARLKTQQRKQETRRKILVGSYYLDKAAKENDWDSLKSIMDEYLTRESDRKLFE